MSRMKLVVSASVLFVCSFCLPTRHAWAMFIETGASTIFDDNFEGDALGAPPSNATVGTWVTSVGSVAVTNAASPGPAQGQNYLSMSRPDSATISGQYSPVNSGTLSVSFNLFIPTGAIDNLFQFSLSPTNTDPGLINIYEAPIWLTNEGSSVTTYVAASDVSTGVSFLKGVWQLWTVDYTFGPNPNDDTFTLTVAGNTSAPINAGGYLNVADPASLQFFGLRAGDSGTFYVDGLAPEPASLGILALGGLMLVRRRTR